MFRSLLMASVVAMSMACGGASAPTTPTSPAPIPAADACGALGALGSMTGGAGILSGAECGVDLAPVVKLTMRSAADTLLGSCSGTLVTPRTVLTAAHCLDQGVSSVRVWLGVGPEYPAQSFVYYPGYEFGRSGFDVGVVFLAEDLPRVPVPILTSRAGRIGETAIIAGFGRSDISETPKLRAGSTRVSRVSDAYIESLHAPPSSSICSGDSGGPILLSEGGAWILAGISSATTGTACNEGTNYYQAVFNVSVRNFVLQQVQTIAQR